MIAYLEKLISFPVKILLVFIIGFVAGAFSINYFDKPNSNLIGSQLRQKNPSYEFIDPLFACISADKSFFDELKTLENKINETVKEKMNSREVDKISVYFRDLETGHWTGINENEKFFPASLLKVPIMIAYFKKAQLNPAVLQSRITYMAPSHEYFGLKTGEKYSIIDLINSMIIDSDNTSRDVLLRFVDKEILSGIFADLDIESPESVEESAPYGISARKYSLLFRTLYDATILDKEFSNKALELLTKTKFNSGLTAKLPSSVPVAHKFGVYNSPPIGNELHDCGIVYTKNPYFLCVMTKGSDQKKLAQTIQDISLEIFNEVGKIYK